MGHDQVGVVRWEWSGVVDRVAGRSVSGVIPIPTPPHPPGVFWIDWKSVCRFFDVAYVNWKHKLFEHKSTIHELVLPTSARQSDV